MRSDGGYAKSVARLQARSEEVRATLREWAMNYEGDWDYLTVTEPRAALHDYLAEQLSEHMPSVCLYSSYDDWSGATEGAMTTESEALIWNVVEALPARELIVGGRIDAS